MTYMIASLREFIFTVRNFSLIIQVYYSMIKFIAAHAKLPDRTL